MVRVSRRPVYDMKGLGHCHLLLSSPHKVWQCPQTHLFLQVAVLCRRKATPGSPMITNTIWSVGLAQTTALGPQRSWSFLTGRPNTSARCCKLHETLANSELYHEGYKDGFQLGRKGCTLVFHFVVLCGGPYVSLETAAHMCLPVIGCLCFTDSS